MATFGERLHLLRIEKDLTIREIAEQLDYGKTTIANWEKDNRFPDRDTIIKLADFFNVTTDYLLGYANNRDGKIYKAEMNGSNYELEIKNPYDLTPSEVKRLIEKLEAYHFNVEKVIEEIKKENKTIE